VPRRSCAVQRAPLALTAQGLTDRPTIITIALYPGAGARVPDH